MSIEAKILLDSVNPGGKRLTTWVLKYPRAIHSEILTHRVFSRNASSTRAIPVNKMIEAVKTNPFIPIHFGKNQAGMQAVEELDNVERKQRAVGKELLEYHAHKNWEPHGTTYHLYNLTDLEYAKYLWLDARDSAVSHAERLVKLGLHKQIAGRVLEPFAHITVIATATEHENFFALRAHKDAQPEFQALAYKMLDLYQTNQPNKLKGGEWHIPFGDNLDMERIHDILSKQYLAVPGNSKDDYTAAPKSAYDMIKLQIASARCARISYLNFEGKDDYEADIALATRLSSSGHWSPFEHCAKAYDGTIPRRSGNFIGWEQYRKTFQAENQRDSRVPDQGGSGVQAY